MRMRGGRFKKVTIALWITALLLLPILPAVTAYGSRMTTTPAVPPGGGGGGSWIRGVAAWITYETYFSEPDRIDLSANVIASIPLEEMELTYTWKIDESTVRTGKNITIYIRDMGVKRIVHVDLEVCSERSHACSVDEADIPLMNWAIMIMISAFFSALIIVIAMYPGRRKKRSR